MRSPPHPTLDVFRTVFRIPRIHHLIVVEGPLRAVRSHRRRLPRSWVEVTVNALASDIYLVVEAETADRSLRVPFQSIGAGKVVRFLRFPDRPHSIRLESTAPEQSTVTAITVREIGPVELVLRAIGKRRNPLARSFGYLRTRGIKASFKKLLRALNPESDTDYARWVAEYDTITEADAVAIRAEIAAMPTHPLISVVMPVYATDPDILRRTIDSVRAQFYPAWQLCIVDDASPDPAVKSVLDNAAAAEPRIKLDYRRSNGGVAVTSNDALALADGELTALLDHDDLLAPHALYMVAKELAAYPDAALIYSDEDKIDETGARRDPYFKSNWNPVLFEGQNYINHLSVFRTSLIRRLGGFRPGFEGSQDYDLVLRLVEQCRADQIRHIPHVLYHWRIAIDAETMSSLGRDDAEAAAMRALDDHFRRVGCAAQIVTLAGGRFRRVIQPIPEPAPRVSLLIPTRDRVELLRQCVTGLLERTDYPDLEIIIIDNESDAPETLAYLSDIVRDPRVSISTQPGAFNFSRLNNRAVATSSGRLLGFINNDIDVIHADWLREMVAQAMRPGVGAVGAKLYYGDDTIQHAGVVLGIGGVGGHAYKGSHRSEPGYFASAKLARNISCVTAACMLMHRTVFEEIGGFDETELTIAFNDVDLCLKIRSTGHAIVWTPFAELYHLESASRGDDFSRANAKRFESEVMVMRRRWGPELDADPYYNPNLTLMNEQGGLAFPPRVRVS